MPEIDSHFDLIVYCSKSQTSFLGVNVLRQQSNLSCLDPVAAWCQIPTPAGPTNVIRFALIHTQGGKRGNIGFDIYTFKGLKFKPCDVKDKEVRLIGFFFLALKALYRF